MDVIIVRFLMKILTPKAKMKIGSGLDQFRHPGWNHWSISLLIHQASQEFFNFFLTDCIFKYFLHFQVNRPRFFSAF